MLKLILIITLLFLLFLLFNNNLDTSEMLENEIELPDAYDKFNIYEEDQSLY